MLLLGVIAFSGNPFATSNAQSGGAIRINKIEGTVWNPDRRPATDLYVELQNENYFAVSRTKTDSAGRFTFRGVSPQHYYIKVVTSGTDYVEHVESIQVGDILAVRMSILKSI